MKQILVIAALLAVGPARSQDASVSLFSGSGNGEPAYAQAIEVASRFGERNEGLRALSTEVVKLDQEAVSGFIAAIVDGPSELTVPYDLSVADVPCTLSSIPEPRRVPSVESGWGIHAECDEAPFEVSLYLDTVLMRIGYRLFTVEPRVQYLIQPLEDTGFAIVRQLP